MARMRQQLRAMNCAGDQSPGDHVPRKYNKVKFGVPLTQSFRKDILPQPLVDVLVYIAKDGVTTNDLFRRPGNPKGVKQIMKNMAEGRQFPLDDFNFYTHASVIKKFLLRIPNGIFGTGGEKALLDAMELKSEMDQQDAVHKVISSQSRPTQKLLALLFGTWFRIIHHAEYSQMSSEALAKSVTGSIFHTCTVSPDKVGYGVKAMKFLIENFACAGVFGRENIQYFVDTTRSGIKIKEMFKYQYKFPSEDLIAREKAQKLFEMVLKKEAKKRGFNVAKDAVSQEDYVGHPVTVTEVHPKATLRRQSSGNQSHTGASEIDCVDCPDQNPTHTAVPHFFNATSASAPDVNADEKYQVHLADTKKMYTTKSLSRFEYVKKRQIDRMRKRSDWFLSVSQNSIYDNDSDPGDRSTSREASMGRTVSETDAGFSDGESVFDQDLKGGTYTPVIVATPLLSGPPRVIVEILQEGDDAVDHQTHPIGYHEPTEITGSRESNLEREIVEQYFVTEQWYKPIQGDF